MFTSKCISKLTSKFISQITSECISKLTRKLTSQITSQITGSRNMIQNMNPVKYFLESIVYLIFFTQHIVYWFERTPMTWRQS